MRSAVPFRATAVAAGLAIALLAASPAAAQWSSDPAVNTPVCTAPQNQFLPALMPSVDGGSIVVWDDLRSGAQTLYGQSFDAAGFAQWTPNGVALAVVPWDKSAVPDGSGGVIVAWFDSQSPPIALHAQRYDVHGVAQWSPGGVIVTNSGFAHTPFVKMVSDGAGGADIVWSTSDNFGPSRLYAQRIDGTGLLMWNGPVSVSTDTTLGSRPQVDTDDAGGLVVAWASYHPVVEGALHVSDVYAQRIDGAGTRQWGEHGIGVAPLTKYSRIFPGIARDAGGGAVVVWQQYHDVASGALATVARPDLFAQRIDGTGAIPWGPDGLPLTLGRPNGVFDDTVCSDGAGGAYVAYFGDSIRIQHVTSDGALPWGASGLSAYRNNGYVAHPIAPAADGGVIAAWGSANLLSAQSISPSGQFRWGPQGLMVSTAIGSKSFPAILGDPYGGATFVWGDSRNSNPDLYGQRVNAGGALDAPAPPEPPNAIHLSLSSTPCPARAGALVHLRFALPTNGRVRLTLYDVSGRRVRTLVDENETQGWGRTVDWDGRDANGQAVATGVYLARLVSVSGAAETRIVRLP